MPEDSHLEAFRKLFEAARNAPAADVPARSPEPRVYQEIREWRAPSAPSDYPKPRLVGSSTTHCHDQVAGDAGAASFLWDSTTHDQPVFDFSTGYRPEDIIALHVALSVVRNGTEQVRQFWFKLPDRVDKGEYTQWLLPVAEFPDAVGSPLFTLLQGLPMPRGDVGAHAPKMRFTLSSDHEYWTAERAVLRASYAAQLERARTHRPYAPTENVMFVGDHGVAIPSCDE